MSDRTEEFLQSLGSESPQSAERVAVLRTLLEKFVELATLDSDLGDLRVAVTALNELLEASTLFSQWRGYPKLAVFGSARTKPENPLFEMARQLSEAMAARGWMTVSGAGPGIMEASAKGAGREHTLGVNIELPFEQFANPFIDAETMLVAMQYFFTRKVAMTRPSNAFAIFPGGLGTMDEAFEVLTLLHTGKTTPAPVVLMDTPDGTFWLRWMDFVRGAIIADDYIGEHDMCLVRLCTSIDDAIAEIERFYSNFVAFEVHSGRGRITMKRPPTAGQLERLALTMPQFNSGAGYLVDDTTNLSFDFEGRNFVSLRLLIDQINAWTD